MGPSPIKIFHPARKSPEKKCSLCQRELQMGLKCRLNELGWTPLTHRRAESRLCLMFSKVNEAVAVSADDYLTPKTSNFKTTHNKAFQIPHSKTEHYKHSFFPKTIVDWNKLSFETVNSAN